MIAVPEEDSGNANKFSKTFGQEKRLDSILENIREQTPSDDNSNTK
jgi:hypothetical protein